MADANTVILPLKVIFILVQFVLIVLIAYARVSNNFSKIIINISLCIGRIHHSDGGQDDFTRHGGVLKFVTDDCALGSHLTFPALRTIHRHNYRYADQCQADKRFVGAIPWLWRTSTRVDDTGYVANGVFADYRRNNCADPVCTRDNADYWPTLKVQYNLLDSLGAKRKGS